MLLVAGGFSTYVARSFAMPGKYYEGPLAPMTAEQQRLAAELHAVVNELAGRIGERHVGRPEQLEQAALFAEGELRKLGYEPRRHEFTVKDVNCRNLEVTVTGTEVPSEIVVVGAHYDSAIGTPGADDNASGVATLLSLAKRARQHPPRRTVRFVAFVNEEPPHFRTKDMGSVRYANEIAARGDKVTAMVSLEMLGYYVDVPKSQRYPSPLDLAFPDTGNFIAFLANGDSVGFLRSTVRSFRRNTAFPALGAALPGVGTGAEFSDNWAFSRHGLPALMVTDTAMMRTPHYHCSTDTADTLDYDRLARVAEGLAKVVREL